MREKINYAMNLLTWLNLFGAGAMMSASFPWGLFKAIEESDGTLAPSMFVIGLLGIASFAFTLYSAFRAFYIYATHQKDRYDG